MRRAAGGFVRGVVFGARSAMVVTAGLAAATPVAAQEWRWPERAENLTELPADFPPDRLRAVMLGFSSALGVRCSHCHVGEEGRPLSTFDFASDANPNKERARAMYRLLGVVNDHLAEIEPSGEAVNMWCHTCHQGRPRPQTLAEAIGERARAEGGAAAVDYFRELRERHYGGPGYDFRPGAVAEIAFGLGEAGHSDAGLALAKSNVEQHPESFEAHEGLGDVLRATGDLRGARAAYERALELAPDDPRIRTKLRAVG
jgi:tetratricopeptide (TPR) repeat protein